MYAFFGKFSIDHVQVILRRDFEILITNPEARIIAQHEYTQLGGGAFNSAFCFAHHLRNADPEPADVKIFAPLGYAKPEIICETLRDEKIGHYDLAVNGGHTHISNSHIFVILENGDRRIIGSPKMEESYRISLTDSQIDEVVSQAQLIRTDLRYFFLFEPFACGAKEKQIPVLIDAGQAVPEDANLIDPDLNVKAVIFSMHGNGAVINETINAFHGRGIDLVIGTDRERPVFYSQKGSPGYSIPVTPVDVKDTLGAGDAFTGALCFHFAQADTISPEAVSSAARFASNTCTTYGRDWVPHTI